MFEATKGRDFVIAAQDGPEPDAGAGLDDDAACHLRLRRHPGIHRDMRAIPSSSQIIGLPPASLGRTNGPRPSLTFAAQPLGRQDGDQRVGAALDIVIDDDIIIFRPMADFGAAFSPSARR